MQEEEERVKEGDRTSLSMAALNKNHAMVGKGGDLVFGMDIGITFSCENVWQHDYVEINTIRYESH